LDEPSALVTGALVASAWALHPVHSAVTAYVSGRADSLAFAGLLTAWLTWENGLRHFQRGKTTSAAFLWLAASVAMLLGMCAKEIAAMGLVLFLTYLWGFRRELGIQFKGKTTCGIALIFGIYLLLRQLPEKLAGGPAPYDFSWLQRGILFLRALGDYGRLLVFPDRLFMERQVTWPNGLLVNSSEVDPLFPYLGWIGTSFLGLLFWSLFWQQPGRELRRLGAMWFLIMILPVSNLFPLNATVAEHWLYIPSVGFGIWLAGCWIPVRRQARGLAFGVAVAIVGALGVRSYSRAGEWKDPVAFFEATIRNGGDSARMRANLAAEYWTRGDAAKVEDIYRSLLKARPGNAWIEGLLAQVLLAQGKKAEADELVSNAAQHSSAAQNEQIVLIDYQMKNKDYAGAARKARKAYEAAPDSWMLATTLASIYRDQNRDGVALQVIKGFVQRHWWNGEAQLEMGMLRAKTGDSEGALEAYKMAAELDVRNPEPLNLAGALLADIGRSEEALRTVHEAIKRDPGKRQQELLRVIQAAATQRNGLEPES